MNVRAKVAITGASSFTGLWIAYEFARAGWDVIAQCSRAPEAYSGLRKLRVELLRKQVPVDFALEAQDFPKWIRSKRPEIWVHHHHFMENFRSADYRSEKAVEVGIKPLPAIVDALAESGCRGIVFSGSFFEPNEGGTQRTSPPTPYAQSKKWVWDELVRLASAKSIPLSKMVMPNPIGPFENDDRVIPQMTLKAQTGEVLKLGSPASVSDQLPVEDLARGYVRLAEALLQGKASISRPSGWVCTVEQMVATINRELITGRLKLPPCPIEKAQASGAATSFVNPEAEREAVDWSRAWDHYADWIRRYPISRP